MNLVSAIFDHAMSATFAALVVTVVLFAADTFAIDDAYGYFACAAAGGTASFTRFLRSQRAWKWRVVIGFTLFGAVAAVAIVGLAFGNDVLTNIWKPLSYSLLIGYGQPEFAGALIQPNGT